MKEISLLLLLSAFVFAEEPKRIALVNSNVPSEWVASSLVDQCQGMALTRNPAKADYFVEIQLEGNRVDLTLFDSSDDAVYWTETIKAHNAIKDMCQFIGERKKKRN